MKPFTFSGEDASEFTVVTEDQQVPTLGSFTDAFIEAVPPADTSDITAMNQRNQKYINAGRQLGVIAVAKPKN